MAAGRGLLMRLERNGEMRKMTPAGTRGFTLIELLVVVGIIMGILAMGTLAMGDFFSQGNFNLGVRAVVNAVRAARQHAVGRRVWVCLELVDTATDLDPNNDQMPDYVAIYELEPTTNQDTGELTWKIPAGVDPIEKVYLPRNVAIVLDDVNPAVSDLWPYGVQNKKGFLFFPSGASRALDDKSNVIIVRDLVSWDEAKVFLYTVTSFVKVRITYHWERE